MRKILLILVIFLGTGPAMAQAKRDTIVAALQLSDVNQMMAVYAEWRRLIVYDPNIKSDEKISLQISIDKYLIGLRERIKIDTIKRKKQ